MTPYVAKQWLLELIGDHDFTVPTDAFNELVEALSENHDKLKKPEMLPDRPSPLLIMDEDEPGKHLEPISAMELVEKYRGVLMWLYTDVWPLVHGLTNRETLKSRFRQLPDWINYPVIKPESDTRNGGDRE